MQLIISGRNVEVTEERSRRTDHRAPPLEALPLDSPPLDDGESPT